MEASKNQEPKYSPSSRALIVLTAHLWKLPCANQQKAANPSPGTVDLDSDNKVKSMHL